MLMQATDFLELHRRYGCTLQMGGSDQWGNIVNGVELIRRMDQAQAFGLTTPLLTTTSGEKMGKTVGGAVWLNADRAEPLRLLADVAQHRGRRRRPVPEAVHRAAAGRDRAAGGAAGRGDQRGQEGAGQRGHRPAARRGGGGRGGGGGEGGVRGGRDCRATCRPSRSPAPRSRRACRWPPSPPTRAWPRRARDARRLAQGGGLRVNDKRRDRRPAPAHPGRPRRRRRRSSWPPAERRSCW